MILNSYFPSSLSQAAAASKPFINDILKVDGVNLTHCNGVFLRISMRVLPPLMILFALILFFKLGLGLYLRVRRR